MSCWTHIVGALYVETFTESSNIKEIVGKRLENVPKITGSEKDADIFINPLSGHNTFITCDCEHCEFGDTIEDLGSGYFRCDAPDNKCCPENEYQTVVAITIVGDLRDREIEQTKTEYNTFLQFIKDLGYDIFYNSCSITDGYGNKEVC